MSGRTETVGGRPAIPSWKAARRRLRESSGTTVPWRVYAARLFEQALYVVVFGGIAAQAVLATTGPDVPGTAPGPGVPADRTAVALLLTLLAFSVLLKALLAVGPVSTSAATASWLLASPLDRRTALLRTVAGMVVAAVCAGLLWPGMVYVLTGFGVAVSGLGVLASGATAAACVGFAVCAQTARRGVAAGCQTVLSVLAAASAVVLVVDRALGGAVLDGVVPEGLGAATAPAAASALVVVAVVLLGASLYALGWLRRSALSSGHTMAVGLMLSVTSFEFGLLGMLMTERRAIRTGYVRSAPVGMRSRLLGLVAADLVRLVRAPGKLLTVGCLLVVPALFASSGPGPATDYQPAVFTLAAFLVADRLAGTLRTVLRSAGLQRLLGVPRPHLGLALSVVPFAGTVVWCCLAAVIAGGVPVVTVVIASVGSIVVVYRMVTKPPLSFDDGAMFDVGVLGPTPLGLIKQLSRGPMLLLVLMIVQTVVV
ncbi:hypothetical protein FRP1_30115 (plasmid) [Pseudonocardia sp. EC080625-04]|uniref:DUF6297 family protein n=1 Tax=unclassified Pseudonocardia TaxID=2619320 RepID=UPI0006CB6A6B|nr:MULTISPECIES: DUF6297 family protein [unclassified Pseudonocardia]ALE76980.1 hypothetical protein FRP1_30115 [Pseudonocardia sp. EC080625-04]ALL85920.1 hypothetical protein AD017_33040 [Pseudonocardia sp. EC080619-01]